MPASRKAFFLVGLGIIAAVAAYWGFFHDSAPVVVTQTAITSQSGAPHARKPAPLFELKTLKDQSVRLQSLKGNVVIVHFWASWCAPCLDEIPALVKFARETEGRPIRILAVSLDDAWPKAEKILPSASLPPNLIAVLDPEGTAPDLYGSYQFPETYVLDRELNIAAKWVGAQPWDKPELRKFLDGLASAQ
jgi:cytochrome c biogenesis protein CcmG, thiol:disulfide interchange protein DsbE